MYTVDDFEDAMLLFAGCFEAVEHKRREREWLKQALRRDFDETTLVWLEPLVIQRWMALRGYLPKGFDALGTFYR